MPSKNITLASLPRAVSSFLWNLPGKICQALFRTIFKKLLDRLQRNATSQDSTVPFVTRSTLPVGYTIATDLIIDDIDGLLGLHISQGTTAPEAVGLWRSRDHFTKSKAAFHTLLNTATNDEGLLLDFVLPTKGWFDRLTIPLLYGTAVTVVAVFATFEAIRNDYSWLFGTPKVDLLDPGKEHDFLIYQPIIVDYPIINSGRSNARIEKIRATVQSDDPSASVDGLIVANTDELRTLEPNKTDVFPIRARGKKPGTYQISYQGRLSNEWLRHAPWQGLTYKVKIWLPGCRVLLDTQNSAVIDEGTHCFVRGVIEVGRSAERGLHCVAAPIGAPGVKVEFAQVLNAASSNPKMLTSNTGNNAKDLTGLSWEIGRVDRFTPVSFVLTLTSSDKLTEEHWSEIIKALKINAEIQ
jgi:hypothetical protein